MGSGKSTIGPILANVLGYEFVDLDKLIEKETKKSVTQIFADEGEEAFRNQELNTLKKILKNKKYIISLGGGTIQSKKTLNLLKQNGILIYLEVEIEMLYKRLRNKTNRPVILNIDGEKLSEIELKKKINLLLEKRKLYYEMAFLTINISATTVGETVDKIIKELNKL